MSKKPTKPVEKNVSSDWWFDTPKESTKTITAWVVEIDGEISPYDVVRTRAVARELRNDSVGWGVKKASVRKVKIEVIKGAR